VRIGELFAGYGGLGLGVQQALGGEVSWVSENDPGASAILAHRLPRVPNLGDVTAVDWAVVEPVEVLCGGFPCQDLSDAGARKGMLAGTRSGLWSEFVRSIAALRPELVIIENVPGLLTGRTAESEDVVRVGPRGGKRVERTHRAMGRVLRDLADLGFDAEWGVFSAAQVGGCHLRKRVFIAAVAAHARGQAWPVRSGLRPAGSGTTRAVGRTI
jgi:DNA (cytosine-5)-methyltransferase 1